MRREEEYAELDGEIADLKEKLRVANLQLNAIKEEWDKNCEHWCIHGETGPCDMVELINKISREGAEGRGTKSENYVPRHLDPSWRRAADMAKEMHRTLGVAENAARCTMIWTPKGWRVTVIRLSDGATKTGRSS